MFCVTAALWRAGVEWAVGEREIERGGGFAQAASKFDWCC